MLYPQSNGNREAITLDGLWEFNPDPDSRGEKEKWYDGLRGSHQISELLKGGKRNETVRTGYPGERR